MVKTGANPEYNVAKNIKLFFTHIKEQSTFFTLRIKALVFSG